ncbi:MAG: geranylgeranyl reductase family protein [Chloroflexota bacterium]
MFDYDTLVIGAGPAGSATAQAIALQGWRVALLERDDFGGQSNVCGGGIEGDDAELIRVPSQIIHKRLVRREHHFPWGVTTITKPHVTLLRREYDRHLSQQAAAAGAELQIRALVRQVELIAPGDLRVRVVSQKTRQETVLRTRIVVFADGAHTLAHKLFGFGFQRRPNTAAAGLIYELDWPGCPLENYEVHFGSQIAPWGYAWLFPKRDLLNVGLICLPSRGKTSRQLEHHLRRFVESHPLLRGRNISRRAGAFIPAAPAERIVHTSMLAVGDAAGMVDPMTEAGITNGIVAAGIAAEVVHQALTQETFAAEFLAQYQRHWQATERFKILRLQHRLTQFFLPASRFDPNFFAKLMQVLFLGEGLSRLQKLQLLLYPLLKSQSTSDTCRRN